MRLVALMASLAILATAVAQRPNHPPPPPPDGPMQILKRIMDAQASLRFAGTRVIRVFLEGRRVELSEVVLRSGLDSRTTYPENSPRAGYIVVERRGQRLEYDPGRNEIRRGRGGRDLAVQLLQQLIELVKQGHVGVQEFPGGQVAGRPTVGILFRDRNGNVARKFWIDHRTGLVLKGEQYGRGGDYQGGFEFVRVNYEPVFNPNWLNLPEVPVVDEDFGIDVPWRIRVPTWIPEGFHETGRGLRRLRGADVVLIHFSNGKDHFSIFQSETRVNLEVPKQGPERVLNFESVRDGPLWAAVVGSLERETLRKILKSLR